MTLSLEFKKLGTVPVVFCRGRIVFREEARVLSEAVKRLLPHCRNVILDLTDVTAVDSAGLGELVSLQMSATEAGSSLKLSGLSSRIRHVLEITNLCSVFETYPTRQAAAESCRTG